MGIQNLNKKKNRILVIVVNEAIVKVAYCSHALSAISVENNWLVSKLTHPVIGQSGFIRRPVKLSS